LVDDRLRQTEARDLGADHAARFRILVEHHAVIAERGEIPCHGERGGAAADERDALAVLGGSWVGQAGSNVVLEIGGDPFQAADRDRILLDAAAPASRLARPIARAPEDSREHVGLPVDHVGVAVATCRDQPDVFRHGRVCRTGPLAIHHLVEVVRRRNVGRFHLLLCTHARRALLENHARTSVGRSSFRGPAYARPNPARILVDAPPKFHRFNRHDSVLRPAKLAVMQLGHDGAPGTYKSASTRSSCSFKLLRLIPSSKQSHVAVRARRRRRISARIMVRRHSIVGSATIWAEYGLTFDQACASAGMTSRTNRSIVRKTSASVRSPKANWATK